MFELDYLDFYILKKNKAMKLTNEQIAILKDGKIEDNRFYLQWQLDRKQYTSINEVLETIGLKWTRGKKAHIIEWFTQEELENAINDVVETGEVETLKETIKKFQFYPTPKEVARYLVKLAELKPWDKVLEPSAWMWDILWEIPRFIVCTAIELDEKKYNHIEQQLCYKDDEIINMDFLEYKEKTFDKIIANPPFSKSQDVIHIIHMYELLNEWWIIVSVASSSIRTRQGRLYDELQSLNPEYYYLPEGSFKESGTMVDTVIVKITK